MARKEKIERILLTFLVGAAGYPGLELLFRGKTHYSMALAGGVCLCLMDFLCVQHLVKWPLWQKALLCGGVITCVELLCGFVWNLLLHCAVWDYSAMPLQLCGQICLPFSLLWCVFSIPCMELCKGLGLLVHARQKKPKSVEKGILLPFPLQKRNDWGTK